jgi:hypothetical protein
MGLDESGLLHAANVWVPTSIYRIPYFLRWVL